MGSDGGFSKIIKQKESKGSFCLLVDKKGGKPNQRKIAGFSRLRKNCVGLLT